MNQRNDVSWTDPHYRRPDIHSRPRTESLLREDREKGQQSEHLASRQRRKNRGPIGVGVVVGMSTPSPAEPCSHGPSGGEKGVELYNPVGPGNRGHSHSAASDRQRRKNVLLRVIDDDPKDPGFEPTGLSRQPRPASVVERSREVVDDLRRQVLKPSDDFLRVEGSTRRAPPPPASKKNAPETVIRSGQGDDPESAASAVEDSLSAPRVGILSRHIRTRPACRAGTCRLPIGSRADCGPHR